MSEIIKTIENITKEGDNIYTYNEIHSRQIRINVEELNEKKITLKAEIILIDYILAEIEKLK